MNTAKTIDNQILRMRTGKLFSYKDIPEYSRSGDAVAKVLSRKTKNGEIVRLKNGLFYKPEKGMFGNMSPKDSDVIKFFTLEKKKTIGYVTGLALYHRWGLTTQVPAEITIATSTNKREKVDVLGLRISTVPARANVTRNNAEILQFLDVLKDINRIPDSSSDEVIKKLANKINSFSYNELAEMEKLAIKAYPPKTKALLGSFLETYKNYVSSSLLKALNPTSTYKISIPNNVLRNQRNWNIAQP